MTNLTMSMFLTKDDLEKARSVERGHTSQCHCPLCDLKVGPDFLQDNTNPELAKKIEQGYDVLDNDHPNTCRCEVCRFWS